MHEQPRELWTKRVERWVASNLTAKEFAAEIGVNYQTLQYWKHKLAKEQREALTGGSAQPLPRSSKRSHKKKGPTPVTFVELSPRHVSSSHIIEIQLRSGTLLRIPLDVDARRLNSLLDVLEARS